MKKKQVKDIKSKLRYINSSIGSWSDFDPFYNYDIVVKFLEDVKLEIEAAHRAWVESESKK